MKPSTIRLSGLLVALGGVVWFTTRLVLGPQPADDMHATEIAGGGVFQMGLLAMLLVMRATNAAGTGRAGRYVLNAGLVFVALATAWTVIVSVDTSLAAATPVMILDVFWPLSMAWLMVVGVAVAWAKAWPTPVRFLPLAASFVIPVHLGAEVVGLTEWQGWALPILYVAVAYVVLGVALIRQIPPLVEHQTDPASASLRAAR